MLSRLQAQRGQRINVLQRQLEKVLRVKVVIYKIWAINARIKKKQIDNDIRAKLTKEIADWDLRSVAIGGGRSARLLRSFLSCTTVGISLNICFLDNGGLDT
jgi:hypothetical protein